MVPRWEVQNIVKSLLQDALDGLYDSVADLTERTAIDAIEILEVKDIKAFLQNAFCSAFNILLFLKLEDKSWFRESFELNIVQVATKNM